MKKTILVLGAYDRYNYGDLLFPYIVEYHLKDINEISSINYYSVRKSDLSKIGGKKTQNITDFYKECNNKENENIVIIAGGETVGVTWDAYYPSLFENGELIRRILTKLKLSALFEVYAKLKLRGTGKFVFSINKGSFKGVKKIIFNANGASSIDAISNRKLLTPILKKVDYLSVRENKSYHNLKCIDVNSHVFPDSAIIMSEIFPVNLLKKWSSQAILNYINNKPYVLFQTNLAIAKKYTNEICRSLEKIKKNDNVQICLCPIGLAYGHNDIEGLEIIKKSLSFEVTFFKNVSLWDIMLLISQSVAFIGTSLHGVITAMSFSVPYISIYPKKIDSYLETWGSYGNNKSVDADKVHLKYMELKRMKKHISEDNRYFQILKSKESFRTILKVIG